MPCRFAPLPDQAYLLECLDYDPDTGKFRWRHRPRHHFVSDRFWKIWNGRYAGTMAGHRGGAVGRVYITLNSKECFAHRIAFKIMTGADPTEQIDHINRQVTDNRWVNLRAATQQQNLANTGIRRNNKTGLKGVYYHKRMQKFVAKIRKNNRYYWLGGYATKEEAHARYCEAAKELFGEYWSVG